MNELKKHMNVGLAGRTISEREGLTELKKDFQLYMFLIRRKVFAVTKDEPVSLSLTYEKFFKSENAGNSRWRNGKK